MTAMRQVQLLESARHLDWLPDETLYSLASRHHRLSGNLRPDQSAQQLFGHRRGGSPHDLPAGLDYFAAALGDRLGTGESLAWERTVLPGLLVFRPEHERHDAINAMRSPQLGGLKSRLGLPASGFGATCLLKACTSCMREDATRHGTAYWHRAHQWPGAWLCLDHDEFLRLSVADRARQLRFDWRLPVLSDLVNVVNCGRPLVRPESQVLQRLTRMAQDAAVAPPVVAGAHLARALWAGMVARGWVTPSGRMDRRVATAEWLAHVRLLQVSPEWRELGQSESAAYSQLQSLLGDPTRGHALRALTLVSRLFDTWQDYRTVVDSLPTYDEEIAPEPPCGDESTLKERLIALTGTSGSISAAAKSVGVAVASAQAWVAASGRSPRKRPSKLRGRTLAQVVDELRQGVDPPAIAILTGISDASVRRVLRTTVGLHGQWQAARRSSNGALARTQWLRALGLSAAAGPKAARALEPKAYAWLYRHDRAWLLATNESAKKPLRGNRATVNWDARDRVLADACQCAALALVENAGGRRINLIDVVRAVPEVRTKLNRLENLPLTARVIRSLVAGALKQQVAAQQAPNRTQGRLHAARPPPRQSSLIIGPGAPGAGDYE